MAPTASPAARFRECIENGRIDAAIELFAEDVVFHSPVAHRPHRGREPLSSVLRAAFAVLDNFHYVAEYAGSDPAAGHALRFRAEVDGRELEGVDILVSGPEEITELTVLMRPYSALTALRDRMAVLLAP